MSKRALKKRRNELQELLADRREALGELVLGMHVQGVWDDSLLARGAAEVKEVEDGLAQLGEDGEADVSETRTAEVVPTPGVEAEAEVVAAPEVEVEVEAETTEDESPDVAAKEGRRGGWFRRRGRRKDSEGEGEAVAPEAPSSHPEFETAEHTAEHRLPPETDGEGSQPKGSEAEKADEPEPTPPPAPPGPKPESTRAKTPEPPPSPESKPATPAPETREEPPATATGREPSTRPKTSGEPPVAAPATPAAAVGGTSPLDDLERRLEQEERSARSGVEAARASVEAESGTEVASLLETLTKDREGLEQALSAASTRLLEADRQAGEATERASRVEAESREAAARWVRDQAAEIEADAAVAAEIAESGPAAPEVDVARVRELETEVDKLRGQVEDEKKEKTRAIEAAEERVRGIEARALEIESEQEQGSETGPSAAELRESAVGWLRGQIVALRREMEATEKKDGGDS